MTQRIERINELLKREISIYIEKNFTFENSLVTTHEAKISSDLRSLDVYLGIIGDKSLNNEILKKLNNNKKYIQKEISKRVILRNTPRITFILDDSIERGVNVLNILDEIEKNNSL